MPRAGRPLKWPGGKAYVASAVIKLMQERPHIHYVEPYCGGCQVLFARNPGFNWSHKSGAHNAGCSEVINDLHGELMNFYAVLQDSSAFPRLQNRLFYTLFSERTWRDAECFWEGNNVERAAKFYIRHRMSRGGEGDDFSTPVRTRTRRGMQDQVSAYLSATDALAEIHMRLRGVMCLSREALEVIGSEDRARTMFYLDPPYPPECRAVIGQYAPYEMGTEDHEALLKKILKCKGSVVISSYPNNLYDKALRKWSCKDVTLKKAASGKRKKPTAVERLWYNW